MRIDMAKVVTERPRRGHGNPSKKWGRRLGRTSTTPRIMDRRAHRSRGIISTAGTPRSSPTSSDRCADTFESRSDVLGTRSGRRSFAISTAVH